MPSGSRSRFPAPAVAALVVALLAGCSSGPGPGSSATSAGSSGAPGGAACPAAPTVLGDLPGWGAPATAPDVTPLLIAPQPTPCGQSRVLFTMLDKTGRPIGAPDRTAKVAFYDLGRDATKPIATLDGTFVWAIENERGIYVVNTSFPESGVFGAEFTTAAAGGQPVTVRLTFEVQPSTSVVRVGDKAPAAKTPTLADAGGDATRISTDASPVPAFYQTSVDRAIADHQPFVLIFATPKFCASAQCGPTLDRIKPFLAKYPTVTFINVEPYKLKLVDGVLQTDVDANNQLQTAPATDAWGLLSEPYVFVVDRNGIVTAAFELIFSDAELTAALDAVK